MTKLRIGSVATSLALAAAFAGFGVAAQAAIPAHPVHADRQQSINDIVGAEIALSHGHRDLARDRTARAETVLLNAAQAHDSFASRALPAIERAHRELLKDQVKAADAALRDAQHALQTARRA